MKRGLTLVGSLVGKSRIGRLLSDELSRCNAKSD
jgi:hypothetical protein